MADDVGGFFVHVNFLVTEYFAPDHGQRLEQETKSPDSRSTLSRL
jgi:hypothetical protein